MSKEDEIKIFKLENKDLRKQVQSKDKELKILREALEFYADENNCNNTESCFVYEIDPYSGDEIADEGYTARQALAEIDKMKGV